MVLDTCNWLEASNRIHDNIEVEKTCLMKVMMIARIGERAAAGWNVTRHDTQWQLHLQQFQQLQQLLSKAFIRTIFYVNPAF